MKAIRAILVPTDFSDCAVEATRFALQLARPLGATVTLLHVYQFPTYFFPDGSAFVASPETISEIVTSVSASLEEAKRRCEADPALISTRSLEGVPFETILEVAANDPFDLIVMGTHGRTGLKHLLLGSVAEKIVRRARCPVITVRHAA